MFMTEIRVLSASGQIGSGFMESSFARGISLKPHVIGSCGFGGGDDGVDWMVEITKEIAKQEGLKFRLATVRSEQDKDYLKRQYRAGRITPLNPAPPISEAIIDRSAHIVGMMGHEPIADAINQGADIVLCGRATDTSLFAA